MNIGHGIELCLLKFTNNIARSCCVQTCISHLHLFDWSFDIEIVRGARRNRCFHGPLRFIACASCACFASGSISLEERSSPCRKDEKSGRYLSSPFRVPNTKLVRYARRDTKVSQISDWRIASKITRRVNNRYVFASREMSRGMSAFWMHPRVSHDDRRREKKREAIRESDTASEEVEREIKGDVTLQWQFYSAKCFSRCIMTAQSETRSPNDRWRRSYRYWSLGSL